MLEPARNCLKVILGSFDHINGKNISKSRKVIAQHAKQLSNVQVAMTPGEERIQAQEVTEAKEARLQSSE